MSTYLPRLVINGRKEKYIVKQITVFYFTSIPTLVAFFYALIIYKKLAKPLQIFCWFLFLSGLIEFLSKILWIQRIPNLPLLHVYVAGGLSCLILFYESVLDGFIDKKIIRTMGVIFLIFTIINSLFFQPINSFNSYALTVESILVVILAITTYIVMMDDLVKEKRQELSQSLNWINSGLFIYYASNLIIFYYADLFMRLFSRDFNLQTWMLHAFFLLIMNLCFIVGLRKGLLSV